jgi:nitroreductase
MSLKEKIIKILEISINAPSGGNSQPWSFQIKNNEIFIFAHPEKDHPILNFRHRGTWLAHGTLVENIKIAAEASDFAPDIKLFPDLTRSNLTAQIKLAEAPPREEKLFYAISQRTTNRQRYNLKPLTSEQKNYLAQSEKEIDGEAKIVWIENRNQIERLSQAVATSEIVTLENQKLHQLFFNEIVWTRQEEERRKSGLFIKTMGLKPPEELFLKLFKYWSIMKIFVKLGFPRKIAASNAKNYATTPIMGLVVLKNNDKEFLTAGRLIERIWLKATTLGFGFHPIGGIMFYWQRIHWEKLDLLSSEHQQMIKEAYQIVADIAGIKNNDDNIVGMLFRLGSVDKAPVRSSKKTPEIEIINI